MVDRFRPKSNKEKSGPTLVKQFEWHVKKSKRKRLRCKVDKHIRNLNFLMQNLQRYSD
jgi:hypothetical protein